VLFIRKSYDQGKTSRDLEGNVLTIPGFGKATLAELIVDANSYRLSMLGLQLGSPTKGGVSAGVASGTAPASPNTTAVDFARGQFIGLRTKPSIL